MRNKDDEIIRLIQDGGDSLSKAMRILYDQYRRKLLRNLSKRVGEEAEDVFHEALVTVVENIMDRKFQGNSALSTYIYAIANKLCLKRFDQKGRDEKYVNRESLKSRTAPDPESLMMGTQKEEVVLNVLGQLKPKNREVLRLWMRKYSMQEIADRLGYESATVVRMTKSRSLKKLADLIDSDLQLKRALQELVAHD